jgi:hypothetical protein
MRKYFGEVTQRAGKVAPLAPRPAQSSVPVSTPPVATTHPLRRRTRRLVTAYLNALARIYLWRRKPTVVAIAGNRGKTVLKRTLAGLLERRFTVRANPRSYNTDIGLPLAVLGLEIDPRSWRQIAGLLLRATGRALLGQPRADLLVLELGARQSGDMARLLRTVRPDWAVVTALASESIENPTELAVLQSEMSRLCQRLPPERLLLCGDDPLLMAAAGGHGSPQGLCRSALQAIPGGYRYFTPASAYTLGPDVVGESAWFALHAAIVLGERLGLDAAMLQDFLRRETGAPAADMPPHPSRAASG